MGRKYLGGRKAASVRLIAKRTANGKCLDCGGDRGGNPIRCDECLKGQARANRERSRRVEGWKPWRPGGKGRPPKHPEQ